MLTLGVSPDLQGKTNSCLVKKKKNVVAITGVCSGRKKREDVQSPSTRDPNVEEIIFICVL